MLKDASYSWWVHPLAVRDGDDIWAGSVDRRGVNHVHVVGEDEQASVALDGPHQADEHNAVALCVGAETVLAAYARHNQDTHIRVQTVDKTTLEASEQQQIEFGADVTYAQFLRNGDTVWLLCRVDRKTWQYVVSTDFGQTWGEPQTLIDGTAHTGLVYALARQTSPTEVLLAVTGHPSNSDLRKIYAARIDLETGDISLPDTTVIGSLGDEGGPALLPSQLSQVAAPNSSDRVRTFDIAMLDGAPAVLYAVWTLAEEGQPATYKCKRWNGSSWAVNAWTLPAGQIFGYNPGTHYHGGATIADDGVTMRTARHDGTQWTVEQWTWGGSTFALDAVVAQSPIRLLRPYPVTGGGWLHQDTLWDDITEYYGDIVVEA